MVEKTKAEIKEKFAHAEYPIQLIGRHVSITEAMKSYAVDKLAKVDRFGGRLIDVMIIMDIQKLMHSVDFIIDINNNKIKVSGRSENMYTSIDLAIAHLEAKIRRYMRRLREHSAQKLATIDMNVNVIGRISPVDEFNDQIEEEQLKKVERELTPHKVVSRESKPLKTLSLGEAIMKMDFSEDLFMIFRSEEDQKLKVIYRRNDGNYGIIEPEK